MNRYIAVVLLLQCFIAASKADTIHPANTTKVTWREILPDYCGLRNERLEVKIMELRKGRRSVINDATKITGPHYTTIRDHPWQVAIIRRDDELLKCGGSIISKYHVLTAAHCFVTETPEKINGVIYNSTSQFNRVVAVGSTRYTEANIWYNISEVYIHRRNDIALLKIDGEFMWSQFIWPICLPAENESYHLRRECHISGFGALGTDKKNKRNWIWSENVHLRTEIVCNQTMKELSINNTEGMFCASRQLEGDVGVDSCKDDHGGPLNCDHMKTKRQVLLGITSFGRGCGWKDHPGVYIKVSKHLQWIRGRLEVSLGYGAIDNLPEDDDVGRSADVPLDV